MKLREFVLLVLIILAGTAVYFYQTGKWDLSWTITDDFILSGKEYSFEESQIIEDPMLTELRVANSHGWVEIRGENRRDISLTFKKKIRRKNEQEAIEVAGKLKPIQEKSDNILALSTNRQDFKKKGFETGFILLVPENLNVEIENSYGPVTVQSVQNLKVRNRHGKVRASEIASLWDVETSFGDVEIKKMSAGGNVRNSHADILVYQASGDIAVENRHGSVRLDDIEGRVKITGRHTEVNLQNVKQDASIETSHEKVYLFNVNGARIKARHSDVKAYQINGHLAVSTTYASVQVAGVEGDLSVDGKNVKLLASEVKAQKINIDTSYENISLDNFSGQTEIKLRHSDLSLKPLSLNSPIDVFSEYCNIKFYWPEGEKAGVELSAKNGAVKWQLSEQPDWKQENGTSFLKAFSQNGPVTIKISTTYGDVTVTPGRTK